MVFAWWTLRELRRHPAAPARRLRDDVMPRGHFEGVCAVCNRFPQVSTVGCRSLLQATDPVVEKTQLRSRPLWNPLIFGMAMLILTMFCVGVAKFNDQAECASSSCSDGRDLLCQMCQLFRPIPLSGLRAW